MRARGRRELIRLLLALMELCWFLPWATMFLGHRLSITVVTVMVTVTLLVALAINRLVSVTAISIFRQQGLVLVGAFVTAFLAIRLTLYPGYPPFDLAWLTELAHSLSQWYEQVPAEVTVLFISVYLWWRGASLSHREISFDGVGFAFRSGVLMLLFSVLLAHFMTPIDARILVVGFFFTGLMALGMARVEEAGLSLDDWRYWVGVTTMASLFVLGLGSLLSRVYSPAGFEALIRWLDPVLAPMRRTAFALLVAIARLLEPLFILLIDFFKDLVQGQEVMQPTPVPAFGEGVKPTQGWAIPQVVAWLLRAAGVALLLVLIWLAFAVVWNWGRREEEVEERAEEREPLRPSLHLDVRSALKELARRLTPPFTNPPGDEVRAIYARLLRLAAKRGVPRHPARTPYEYLGELARAFPYVRDELREITDAYVVVRYAGQKPSPSRLQKVRAMWKRIAGAIGRE